MVEQFSTDQFTTKKKVKDNGDGNVPSRMFHYLMNVIVFQFKVTSLEYFLDVMTEWEINDIIENLPYLDRNLWESQRLLALIDASKFSKKKIDLKDICKFKWDDDYEEEEHITKMTDEDINRLKQIAKQWEEKD